MLYAVSEALQRCLPGLAPEVCLERDDMAYTLIVHFCAQRERNTDPQWPITANRLVDAVEGLYRAPMTPPGQNA